MAVHPASSRKKSAGTCEEDKSRRAKMRDPAGKKKRTICAGKVGSAEIGLGKEPSHMVKRHEYDYESTHEIHGRDIGRRWCRRSRWGSLVQHETFHILLEVELSPHTGPCRWFPKIHPEK